MKLDEKLVHLRKEKGLTQLELAEAMNVSRQAVSKWEAGGTLPSTENLRSLSELYGVSVDYLLNEGEEMEIKGNDSPEEEAKDNLGTVHDGTKRTTIKWVGIVFAFSILVVFIVLFIVSKSQEKHFSMEDMIGEEVVSGPDGSFSIGW